MRRIIFNDYVDAALAGFFMVVVVAVLVYGIKTVLNARNSNSPTVKESPFVAAPTAQVQ